MTRRGSYSALNASSSARLPLSSQSTARTEEDSEDLSEIEAARAHIERVRDEEDTGLLTGEKKEEEVEGIAAVEGRSKKWLSSVKASLGHKLAIARFLLLWGTRPPDTHADHV